MPNQASELLKSKSEKIMKNWEERANSEVLPAFELESLALRDSLPELLKQIADALSTTIDRTEARKIWDRKESLRIGQKHGRERASSHTYTMDQMIFEYRILREVICDVMEENKPLSPVSREVIVGAIEQAVNDAATQFSETLKLIQERLASSLTHDLRGPITVAKMCSQIMMERADDSTLVLGTATKILKSMDRLDSMIGDLLDASLIRTGESLPLKLENCDLMEIVNECAEELNLIYSGRFVVVADTMVNGCWSKVGLRRIIDNLATNAIKYGAQNTAVTLSVSQNDSNVIFSIHNEGPAISTEDQKILFKEFCRAKSAEGQKGWGLGLTVVKGLAEAHHGSVSVKSDSANGTTFIVEMPKFKPQHGLVKDDLPKKQLLDNERSAEHLSFS
jgi:signal transduction histidine kinase